MIEIIKQNKIMLVIVVIIIAAFAWFGLSDRKPSTSLLKTESRSSASVAEQEIVRLLLDMRSIKLDSSIFENQAFVSLRDFGRDIIPEPVGRTNPFAPLGSVFEISKEQRANNAVFAK